jgi:hypothetical protein
MRKIIEQQYVVRSVCAQIYFAVSMALEALQFRARRDSDSKQPRRSNSPRPNPLSLIAGNVRKLKVVPAKGE